MWMIKYWIETRRTFERFEHFEQFNSQLFNSYLHWSVSLYSIEWVWVRVCTVHNELTNTLKRWPIQRIYERAHIYASTCTTTTTTTITTLVASIYKHARNQESHLHSTQMHCMRACVSPISNTLRIDLHTHTRTNSFTWSSSSSTPAPIPSITLK